jgi:hypothetical protein
VVDAEEERVGLPLPARVALAGGKEDDLERVVIGVLEVEGFDAAGVRIPVG